MVTCFVLKAIKRGYKTSSTEIYLENRILEHSVLRECVVSNLNRFVLKIFLEGSIL